MLITARVYKNRYFQELVIFMAMFALTMLHEWMKMETFMDLMKGLIFFILLYSQAQFHRVLLFPLFLARRFGVYITLLLASALAVSGVLFALDYYWIAPEIFQGEPLLKSILYHFVLCMVSTFMILSLFLVRQYSSALQKRNEAQLLLSEMNMKFMHAQLNPHFFFNMFNNLYAVSLTDPGRTPGLILKLSALMRYQLDNGNKEFVRIADELAFIENYVAMERERTGKRCEIFYRASDEVGLLLQTHRIAPLILITLVENAFKHSVTVSRKWFVNIQINLVGDKLTLDIRNSMPDKNLASSSTGVGLTNIRERLKMLYAQTHELAIISDEHVFQITLSLHLNALHG